MQEIIKCLCGAEAHVILREGRYFLYCPTCGYEGLLKTHHIKKECKNCGREILDLLSAYEDEWCSEACYADFQERRVEDLREATWKEERKDKIEKQI